jgi:hypothetical protein
MTNIITQLTKFLLKILKLRGVDVSKLNPTNSSELSYNKMKEKLIFVQSEISIKRAEIIEKQNNLMVGIEPFLFDKMSNANNGWETNTITKFWVETLNDVRKIIDEHEQLITDFENLYNEINNLKKK